MIRSIPAQQIRVCDICENETNHKLQATVTIDRQSCDYLGDAQGTRKRHIHLCDRCILSFESRFEDWNKEWKGRE